jgi:hypothetical protein
MFFILFLPRQSIKLGSILTDVEGRTTARAESSPRRNHDTDGASSATSMLGMQRLQMRDALAEDFSLLTAASLLVRHRYHIVIVLLF